MSEWKTVEIGGETLELRKVYVYPDGSNYDSPPNWMSDDYQIRWTAMCPKCEVELHLSYAEAEGECLCGKKTWYF